MLFLICGCWDQMTGPPGATVPRVTAVTWKLQELPCVPYCSKGGGMEMGLFLWSEKTLDNFRKSWGLGDIFNILSDPSLGCFLGQFVSSNPFTLSS